ncbi:heterokaryon incompatibility protein-domain-containing protein, partial [Mariannaea sp. PMI_226]
PTRVIDVGSSDGQEPRLYVSSGEVAPYTTLSYRWGENLDHRTVKANFQERLDKLPMSSLPALYQDAITVTRGLGVRYLWIDSLCIIQDDNEDWQREAGTMASVYGHSYLCISASSSPYPEAGLAPPRPVPLSYTGVTGLSSIYSTIARGWCFQERYLSPRIVHYDLGETIWECRETFQCECTDIAGLGYVRGRGEYTAFLRKALNPNPPADFDFVYDWAMLLQQYTSTSLTYESDILPALSGIATQVSSAGKGAYLAGLWREQLERQMYW